VSFVVRYFKCTQILAYPVSRLRHSAPRCTGGPVNAVRLSVNSEPTLGPKLSVETHRPTQNKCHQGRSGPDTPSAQELSERRVRPQLVTFGYLLCMLREAALAGIDLSGRSSVVEGGHEPVREFNTAPSDGPVRLTVIAPTRRPPGTWGSPGRPSAKESTFLRRLVRLRRQRLVRQTRERPPTRAEQMRQLLRMVLFGLVGLSAQCVDHSTRRRARVSVAGRTTRERGQGFGPGRISDGDQPEGTGSSTARPTSGQFCYG
jgi:hypothetical protein